MTRLEMDASLYLRTFTQEDAPELFDLTHANRARLRQWMPWVDATLTTEDSVRFIAHSKQAASDGDYQFGIFESHVLLGVIGFNRTDGPNCSSMIGYWIDEKSEGRGIVTHAVQTILHFGFEIEKLNRLVIRAQPSNTRSVAVPKRLGFQFEGVARRAEQLYGQFVDLEIYALLASQWYEGLNHRPNNVSE